MSLKLVEYFNKSFEKESRVVFRKLGFVMIYAVTGEMSLSVPTPSLLINNI